MWYVDRYMSTSDVLFKALCMGVFKNCALVSPDQHHYEYLRWNSLWEALCKLYKEHFLALINSPEVKLNLGKSN